MKIGTTTISKAFIGSTAIQKILNGVNLIWQNIVLTNGIWNQVINSLASGTGITAQTTFTGYRATKIKGRIEGNNYGDNSVFKMEVQENGSWVTINSQVKNISTSFELTVDIDKIITGLRISWNGGAYVSRYCRIETIQRWV